MDITVNPADEQEALVEQLIGYLHQGVEAGQEIGNVAADWVETAEAAGLTPEYASQLKRKALNRLASE